MRRRSCSLTNSVENFGSAEVEVLGSSVLSIKLEGSATMLVSDDRGAIVELFFEAGPPLLACASL